ncbi:hypothetical protein [Dysgonomonas sp. ZJ709]|uniref:hypothetical protein n=1 Tax=Dysgonomonas sp. ZJ709 TaxID=2709797 RepID=UPI0013EAFF95|nr:hypothetical protein [Dysgonomonas sp. ZJ709]
MKRTICYLLGTIGLIFVGYIIAAFIPIDFFKPQFEPDTISKGQYYGNLVELLGATGTITAVIVALFLDDIKSLFKKVKFQVQLINEEISEEIGKGQGSTKKAVRYFHSIEIINNGNINADNCQLYLENLTFKNDSLKHPIKLLTKNSPIKWEQVDKDEVYIPRSGKKIMEIFYISPPQITGTPEQSGDPIPAKLSLIGADIEHEYLGGKWIADLCIYSSNCQPFKFKVEIDWNGEWHDRQKEMNNMIKVNINKI